MPTAVGGSTSGSESTVSIADLPGPRYRASAKATATPIGRMRSVPRAAIRSVKRTTSSSSRVSTRYMPGRTMNPRRW